MSILTTFLRNGDELYEVFSIKPDSGSKDVNKLHVWKKHVGADHIFKKDLMIYFCKKVEDAEIIEYTVLDKNRDTGSIIKDTLENNQS
jgi:hypothetical protein